jgi:hypothetical protein
MTHQYLSDHGPITAADLRNFAQVTSAISNRPEPWMTPDGCDVTHAAAAVSF